MTELVWKPRTNIVAIRSPRVDTVARNVRKARNSLAALIVERKEQWVMAADWPRSLKLNMPHALIPKTQKEFEDLDAAVLTAHRWTAVASALIKTYPTWTAEYKMLENALK